MLNDVGDISIRQYASRLRSRAATCGRGLTCFGPSARRVCIFWNSRNSQRFLLLFAAVPPKTGVHSLFNAPSAHCRLETALA
jgi:hypothetical protein